MALVKATTDTAKAGQKALVNIGTALTKQFKGFNIRVRELDGYIHATDMCNVGKKKWAHYNENKRTQKFIIELSTSVGIPIDLLIESKSSGINELRGTWVHPHIAINLAQWVSPMFAVKVSGWVARFISGDLTLAKEVLENNDSENNTTTSFESRVNPDTGERLVIAETISNDTLKSYDEHLKFTAFKRKYNNMINKQKNIIIEKDTIIADIRKIMFDQKMQIQELLGYAKNTSNKLSEESKKSTLLHEKLGETKTELTSVSNKLDKVLPQRVNINLSDPNHPQVFILRDCDAEEDEHNLYAMRCQTSSYKAQLKKLKSKYGNNIRRVLTIKQPNAVVFWNRIKKELHDNIKCYKNTNWFSLVNMTKIQFKRKVIDLNTKRMTL